MIRAMRWTIALWRDCLAHLAMVNGTGVQPRPARRDAARVRPRGSRAELRRARGNG